jgi:hypothetical protein
MDERGYTDDQIDYGQVLMTRKKPLVEESPEEAYVSEWLNDK